VRNAAIVASGGANIASLQFALARLGCASTLTTDADDVADATHVILPGVGAAPDAMARLAEAGLVDVIPRLRQPVLGICLGMQLLFEASDEGDTPCLGILPGRVRRLASSAELPVPHMGWNRLTVRRDRPLIEGLGDGYAYFAHGYGTASGTHTLASCAYGEEFAAVVEQGNFCGTQFHPERSGPLGARLLANFLARS